jgi:hypothetical protein
MAEVFVRLRLKSYRQLKLILCFKKLTDCEE